MIPNRSDNKFPDCLVGSIPSTKKAEPVNKARGSASEQSRSFQILFRFCIKCLLAAGGTEEVGLSLIFAPEFCRFFFDIHFAYWVNGHSFTSLLLSLQEVYMF